MHIHPKYSLVWGLVLRVCVRSVRVWNVRVTSSARTFHTRTLRAHTLSTRPHTQVLVNISLSFVLSLFPLYILWFENVYRSVHMKVLMSKCFLNLSYQYLITPQTKEHYIFRIGYSLVQFFCPSSSFFCFFILLLPFFHEGFENLSKWYFLLTNLLQIDKIKINRSLRLSPMRTYHVFFKKHWPHFPCNPFFRTWMNHRASHLA